MDVRTKSGNRVLYELDNGEGYHELSQIDVDYIASSFLSPEWAIVKKSSLDSAQPTAACVKDGSRCVRTDHDQSDTWHITQSDLAKHHCTRTGAFCLATLNLCRCLCATCRHGWGSD